MNKKINIGITIGDPSGIGPEVVVKSLENFKQPKDSLIYIFGDEVALIKNRLRKNKDKIKLVDLKQIKNLEFKFGLISKKFGKASLAYLKEAVSFLKRGEIDCLVTAPVNKEAINLGNIKFSGHTEFLASAFGVKNTVMMFVSDKLKLSLVTRHMALNKVSRYLNKNTIFNTLTLTHHALKYYLGIKKPKIVVLGLNPHASEDGLMGNEEERVIEPAIMEFSKISKSIYGPFPPDTVFRRVLDNEFDAAICMYHDQGLIPFKIFSFNNGVNLTLGLPFIRTSCVHGTAFEIAGKNKADYHSMLEAMKLAYRLTKNKLER
ncbi:MAG: 4-hydroxythreonine-4-phosphate dehydrogenase PdxA [Candidatus Omnitrophota bacterium]